MKILIFINSLSLGGTEKAACYWAVGLQGRGHSISVLSLRDGPRKKFLEDAGIDVKISEPKADLIRDQLLLITPDVIHPHDPEYVHEGDIIEKKATPTTRFSFLSDSRKKFKLIFEN